ncbi:MAG: hypothetical protein ACFE0J_22830 [Elainellaceae cyanobacterium]
MANRKTDDIRKQYEEKYQAHQNRHWEMLKNQLESLRDNYDVSVADLAEGLGISRQKLYNFMGNPSEGLPIQRSDLIILWDILTDPNALKKKRLSANAKTKRQDLREKGFNSLLDAAGFAHSDRANSQHHAEGETRHVDPSLNRVIARLSSAWIEDDILRARIIDSVLNAVLDQGRMNRNFYMAPMSVEQALAWPQGEPLRSQHKHAIDEYQREIRQLARSGKIDFVAAELFELYQNIDEHQSIENYSGATLDIIDCQFQVLSVPLPESVQDEFEPFSTIYLNAEKKLIRLLGDLGKDSLKDAELEPNFFIPVIEASIRSRFGHDRNYVTWRYSSTATHLENMLSAIGSGLSYALDVTGFSIRATGASAKSLARVSIGLTEMDRNRAPKKVYQGWWVGSNAILSVLKAVVVASKDWLSNHQANLSEYYDICEKLAIIDNQLFNIRETVYEYFFRSAQDYYAPYEVVEDHSSFDAIEDQISALSQFLSSDHQRVKPYYRIHHMALENRLIKTRLTRVRLALKTSDIEVAAMHLHEAKEFVEHYETLTTKSIDSFADSAYMHVLFLHASECLMLYSFFTGDKEFLNGKLWRHSARFRLKDCLKRLSKYIKVTGSLNFDTFSCASQLFGTIGILEFYTAHDRDGDEEALKDAAEQLIMAAHYSNRIGYTRRATYWLVHASRVYCRLGEFDLSERLSNIAQKTAETIHQRLQEESDYDSKYKNLINATTRLVHGERLLAQEQPKQALEAFLEALNIFIEIRFTDRLTADTLYGLYRASQHIESAVEDAFADLGSNSDKSSSQHGMEAVMQEAISALRHLDTTSSWRSISSYFKTHAKAIWHHWATVGAGQDEVHPIEDEIERDRFLARVSYS